MQPEKPSNGTWLFHLGFKTHERIPCRGFLICFLCDSSQSETHSGRRFKWRSKEMKCLLRFTVLYPSIIVLFAYYLVFVFNSHRSFLKWTRRKKCRCHFVKKIRMIIGTLTAPRNVMNCSDWQMIEKGPLKMYLVRKMRLSQKHSTRNCRLGTCSSFRRTTQNNCSCCSPNKNE